MTIHPRSSSETYFIYCVGQSEEQFKAFTKAMADASIPAKPLLGRYEGQDEQSFISRMSNYHQIKPWLNAEESILHIHSFDVFHHPKATLKFLSKGTELELGRMIPVSKEEALREDAYTYDPTYNIYFVCRKLGDPIRLPAGAYSYPARKQNQLEQAQR